MIDPLDHFERIASALYRLFGGDRSAIETWTLCAWTALWGCVAAFGGWRLGTGRYRSGLIVGLIGLLILGIGL